MLLIRQMVHPTTPDQVTLLLTNGGASGGWKTDGVLATLPAIHAAEPL